jgi:transcription initiation factor IIF auxiliary subunit
MNPVDITPVKSSYHIFFVTRCKSQTLSRIERVTYYLHPTFRQSFVSFYSAEDSFAISFTAWGKFDILAKIYFKNNKEMDLSLPKESGYSGREF